MQDCRVALFGLRRTIPCVVLSTAAERRPWCSRRQPRINSMGACLSATTPLYILYKWSAKTIYVRHGVSVSDNGDVATDQCLRASSRRFVPSIRGGASRSSYLISKCISCATHYLAGERSKHPKETTKRVSDEHAAEQTIRELATSDVYGKTIDHIITHLTSACHKVGHQTSWGASLQSAVETTVVCVNG